MKKLIVGLLAAFLMTSGLAAFSTTSASAAPPCPNYSGCFDTTARVGGINAGKRRATIAAVVNVVGANRNAQGVVKFVIKGDDFYQAGKARLTNGSANFTTRRLDKGRYTAKVRYIRKPGSPFNPSNSGKRGFRI